MVSARSNGGESGQETPRVRVTLATSIPEQRCRRISFGTPIPRPSILGSGRGARRKAYSSCLTPARSSAGTGIGSGGTRSAVKRPRRPARSRAGFRVRFHAVLRSRRGVTLLVVAGLAVLLAANYLRPIPRVAASQTLPGSLTRGTAPVLPWPDRGQAAVGADEAGVLAATPGARPEPIASVAKVMTALVALDARPLSKGESGPALTITQAEVSEYQQAQGNEESFIPVQAGEQLSEYQALQALLLPSANNIALLLARWSLGSQEAFVAKMNTTAQQLGLKQTKFADASGVSPQTVSVPADLVRLGTVAMKNAVIADIVGQADATLPVAGKVYNVNGVLGTDGIVGVKTGNVVEVGAVYLAAATHELAGGRKLLIYAAVQGLPTRDESFTTARALLATMRQSLQLQRVVSREQVVGRYAAPWGSSADIVTQSDLDFVVLPGTAVRARLVAQGVQAPVAPGPVLGSLRVQAGDHVADVPVSVEQELEGATSLWRLTRLS